MPFRIIYSPHLLEFHWGVCNSSWYMPSDVYSTRDEEVTWDGVNKVPMTHLFFEKWIIECWWPVCPEKGLDIWTAMLYFRGVLGGMTVVVETVEFTKHSI